MDSRTHQDDVLLGRLMLKQVNNEVYQAYRTLLKENPQHALTLVAGIMCLHRYGLLESHIQSLIEAPQQAYQIAAEAAGIYRPTNPVKASISLRQLPTPYMAEINLMKYALLQLENNGLEKMGKYITNDAAHTYQLSTGFVLLAKSGYLHDGANVEILINHPAVASHLAQIIILLDKSKLFDYLGPVLTHLECIHAVIYVLTHFNMDERLNIALLNQFNKTETLKFIHYAYNNICEKDALPFMALTSPADKAQLILRAVVRRFQRKELRSNCVSFPYASLQIEQESTATRGVQYK